MQIWDREYIYSNHFRVDQNITCTEQTHFYESFFVLILKASFLISPMKLANLLRRIVFPQYIAVNMMILILFVHHTLFVYWGHLLELSLLLLSTHKSRHREMQTQRLYPYVIFVPFCHFNLNELEPESKLNFWGVLHRKKWISSIKMWFNSTINLNYQQLQTCCNHHLTWLSQGYR